MANPVPTDHPMDLYLNVLRYEDPAILMSQEPNTSSVQEITNTVTGASASARKDTYVH